MIKNNLKIAWRNLIRNFSTSFINIAGLAVGIATCLLISLYVIDEFSFDRYNEHADRIVRVVFRGTVKGGTINEAHVMPPVASTMKSELPEVEETARLRIGGSPLFVVNNKVFHEEKMAYVDASFFKIFTLPFIKGNKSTAIANPNAVVISESTALKYFGTKDVVGRDLSVKDNPTILKITGVIKDIPKNSHFHFDVFTSLDALEDSRSDSWMTSEYYTYALLSKNASREKLEKNLATLFDKHVATQFMAGFGMSYQEYKKTGNQIGLYLQPLTDIHLHSNFNYDLSAPGDIRYVYIFSAIALFMLLIATINFMNLSTASGFRRCKEVGVRKVLGADKQNLMRQFMLEGVLLTYISLGIALGIVLLALPLFNQISGKEIEIQKLDAFKIIPFLLTFGLVVGLFSSSYPALYLSSFNPLRVLKGKISRSTKGLNLRSGLVVFQFIISVGLIFGTVVVVQQLDYMRHIKLGYNKDNVLIIPSWPLGKNEKTYYNLLMQDSRIKHVSHSSYLPAGESNNNNFFIYPDGNTDQWVKTIRYDIDEEYIPVMGMQLKEGRNFTKTFGNDSLSVIINETAAKDLGWNDHSLGKILTNKDNKSYRVIGVVKDFHFRSLHEQISPLVMVLSDQAGSLILKTQTADMEKLIQKLASLYRSFPTDIPFSYSFLDDRYAQTYQAEVKTGKLLSIFAGLTIFVACLGLFGLAIFTANQRRKEIGIRKVVGATVPDITRMLSTEFVKLVLIAIIISSPLAWWMMHKWLENFAYRIEMQWWMFVLAGALAVFIALITVSSQAIRAALTKPVDSLRDE
ncbi:ABC transporter permease [Sphingobacterium sp. UGAL515B_05]|uniref:ABC transporter permease n=1 Tax=Sphingobacterium sp. UGAL515B_05 TaxID=2986767 RepID=UPI00295599E7|nr:ABC transporter permease [Sphingobacterium sp. UGAL515B_05]WON95446.1 ABC transporter permease [Sphingobacterium sp. UGAL515B_05]